MDSSTDVTTDAGIDLWRVQMPTGEVRAMSLDALDEAFQAGSITEDSPVLPPGATAWTRLASAAGLDTPEPEALAPSLAPLAVSIAGRAGDAAPFSSMSPYPTMDLDDLDASPDAFKAKKGRVLAVIGVAAILVGAAGFGASRVAGSAGASAQNSLSAHGPDTKAAAATPPPEAVDPSTLEGSRARALTEDQKAKLAEADKAREAKEAQKKKDRPAPPARRAPHEKSAPFVNGGNKFDPLNGAL